MYPLSADNKTACISFAGESYESCGYALKQLNAPETYKAFKRTGDISHDQLQACFFCEIVN